MSAASSGNSATSSSGSASTTNATDLIFGANVATSLTSGPGSGFTQRLLTSPDGDIAEDEMVTVMGSYGPPRRSVPPRRGSCRWLLFARHGRRQPPTAPSNLTAAAASASQINLGWTASTSSVGIANYVVQRCQGAGCTNFSQIATPTGTTYSDTGLASNTNYSYEVQAEDTARNLSGFSNVASATTLASTGSPISYIQGNYATPQAAQSTVTVSYTATQAAGDLNVIVVGWNDTTATVSSVTDKSGNTYTLAVGPTLIGSALSQSIYYAKSIASADRGS